MEKTLLITNWGIFDFWLDIWLRWAWCSQTSLGGVRGNAMSSEEPSVGWQFTLGSDSNLHNLGLFFGGNGLTIHSAYLLGLWTADEKVHHEQWGPSLPVCVSRVSRSSWAHQTAFLCTWAFSAFETDRETRPYFQKETAKFLMLWRLGTFYWFYWFHRHSLIMKNIHGQWF